MSFTLRLMLALERLNRLLLSIDRRKESTVGTSRIFLKRTSRFSGKGGEKIERPRRLLSGRCTRMLLRARLKGVVSCQPGLLLRLHPAVLFSQCTYREVRGQAL